MTFRKSIWFAGLMALVLSAGGCYRALDSVIREPVEATYGIESDAFRDSMGNLMGAPLVVGNDVVQLLNGDAVFSAMLKDIQRAERTITIEQYIWSSGAVSDLFVPALIERARAGVKILVTVDGVGSSKLNRVDRKKLTDAGVKLNVFNPVLFSRFRQAKHRTHRKILVVDGRVGYIGGVCMSDDWRGNAQPGRWRDTHFRVEGPVVGQIQRAFLANWIEMRSEALHGPDFFPHLPKAGSMVAQCFFSGPHGGADSARTNYLLSFAAARKHIRIQHAYFAPDDGIIEQLLKARERGVNVEIIIPKKIDNPAVAKASRSEFERLIKAGVTFYQYEPTLMHCKVVIVDDCCSMVGSVNFDQRSLRINDEANLNVLDRHLAGQLIRTFEEDKKVSSLLTLEKLKSRNLFTKMSDHLFGFLRSEL